MAVTVAELKAHLNLEHDEDDALLAKKIAAATSWIEGFTAAPITATDTPAALDEATLQLAAHWYLDRRQEDGAGIPVAVRSLCSPFIVWAV